ncbi:MAG: RDD family protein [Thermodesulfobacteriota bacterium]|nr:RDD family protein [Thermodesulfobacteriota bacterium]
MKWYYKDGEQQFGPLGDDEFQDMVKIGTIHGDTFVRNNTMTKWIRYGYVSSVTPDVMTEPEDVHDALELSCSQCGKRFLKEDMIRYENVWVCASCKPLFIQKIKEGVSVGGIREYAGFWLRFAALILDYIFMFFVQMVIFIPTGFITAQMKLPAPGTSPDMSVMAPFMTLQLLLSLLSYAIYIAYETWFIGKYGATLGKMACKIKVITSDGGRVSYLRAFGRYFAKMISGLILGIGYIMAAFDDQKRSLHDRICDTRVIKK